MIKIKKQKKKIIKFSKTFIQNLKILVLSIGVIMIWRSVWNFLDHYFIVDDFLLSNMLTLVLGIFILLLNNFDLDELGISGPNNHQ